MPGSQARGPLTSRAMSSHRRAVVAFLVAVGCVTLAGCGDNGTAADDSPTEVRDASYVTIEPATTTTTIAAVSTTVPPEGATDPNEQVYVIAGGDTVWGIANKHGITIEQLVTYNQWTDGQGHLLIAGQEVRIPPNSKVPGTGSGATGATGTTPPASGGTTPPASESEGCTHTIEAGDNPTRVSEQYDISVQVLEQANAGNSAYQSFPIGGTLNIPAGASC
jgi:LysM repeat protein